jgi:glucose-fructose oxidoreductase
MRIAGLDFSHMHMGDNLAMVVRHPDAELVGVWDARPERMQPVIEALGLEDGLVYDDWRACLAEARPELVIACPPTGEHADWVERLAPYGVHVLMEKPFAASLADADRMLRAMQASPGRLAINWPLAWYPPHVTARRLIDEGTLGDVLTVNYYDGNRGPLYHLEAKRETSAEFRAAEKARSWFYSRAQGGGSLLDYLGYGATLGTWFLGGRAPLEVTSVTDEPPGLEVDEHSITVARYAEGLCRFETRWGTFSDPWTHQPQPKCGFEIIGSEGTLTSYDYEATVQLQTRAHPAIRTLPADVLEPPFQDPVQYMLHCIEHELPIEGPLAPALARIGQQIVDTAVLSAREQRTVPLVP